MCLHGGTQFQEVLSCECPRRTGTEVLHDHVCSMKGYCPVAVSEQIMYRAHLGSPMHPKVGTGSQTTEPQIMEGSVSERQAPYRVTGTEPRCLPHPSVSQSVYSQADLRH